MNRAVAIRIVCLAFVFTIAANATEVRAQQSDLKRLLVGTWRQVLGPYVTQTMFTPDRHFTTVTVQQGTPYRQLCKGTWNTKGNLLTLYFGTCTPKRNVRMPASESTLIRVIDANHLRNKLGDVYRVQ